MRKILEFVGCVAALMAIAVCGITTWSHGLFQYVVPPRTVAPVSVAIHGSDEILAGSETIFSIKTSGEAGIPTYKLVPDDPKAITVVDPLTLKFSSLNAGTYVLTVSVGGDAKMSATAFHIFENLAFKEDSGEPAPAQPSIDLNLLKALMQQSSMHKEPPKPTVKELAAASIEQVQSANRAEECRVLAGVFRSIINRINTGLMAPEADPLGEIQDQIDLALGEHAHNWNGFTADMRGIMNSLRDQGVVITAPTAVPALEEMAGALTQHSSLPH